MDIHEAINWCAEHNATIRFADEGLPNLHFMKKTIGVTYRLNGINYGMASFVEFSQWDNIHAALTRVVENLKENAPPGLVDPNGAGVGV